MTNSSTWNFISLVDYCDHRSKLSLDLINIKPLYIIDGEEVIFCTHDIYDELYMETNNFSAVPNNLKKIGLLFDIGINDHIDKN